MIHLLLLAAAPVTEGPYDWCVERIVDWTQQEAYCTQPGEAPRAIAAGNAQAKAPKVNLAPVNAAAARKLALAQFALIEPDAAARELWAKGISFTTPGSGRKLEWVIPAKSGTFIRVTVINRARW